MKKLASILVLVFAFTLTTQAQKKRKQQKPKLTTEQQTILAVKKLALTLDLTAAQQRQLKPLVATKIADRKAAMEKRKAMRVAKKKPTSDEVFAMKNNLLDKQIAMKNKMKNILNEDQFKKFEKMQKGKKMRIAKKMKRRKGVVMKKRIKKERKV